MVIRHEYEEWTENGIKTQSVMLFDGEINPANVSIFGELSISKTADDGIKFSICKEDEMAQESRYEIILTKADLDRIKEFEQKGLI